MTEHKFDPVLHYCIYCHLSLKEYYVTNKPCDRIMEPEE